LPEPAFFRFTSASARWIESAARAALERRTVHITDILADPEYTYGSKFIESFRTVLGVPILKGDEVFQRPHESHNTWPKKSE